MTVSIFPAGGMAHSVVTTVWVGVLVSVFFNLRLGWPLAGLLLPGYLAPLIIQRPWAVATIGFEGLLTYGLVRLITEYLAVRLGSASLFGRDRFFALLVGSVLVRAGCELGIFPVVGDWINRTYHLNFDHAGQLHSFGLVTVALVANQFWRCGVAGGLWIQGVTVGITYVLVRYVLMEHTNFNVASLEYMYEEVAASFLASPKSYIVLLSTAFVASRLNLEHGWDFHGIIVPALLGLMWHDPLKIAATFVEALVLVASARLLLRMPPLRGATVEGGRKILLFFNLAFAYRMALAALLPRFFPSMKVTDAFGFGYLLSSLIAITMHDKTGAIRSIRMTLECSLIGALLGSALGFAMTLLPGGEAAPDTPLPVPPAAERAGTPRMLDAVRFEKRHLLARRAPGTVPAPRATELAAFAAGIERLVAPRGSEGPALREAARLFSEAGFEVDEVEGRYYLIRERQPSRGWGLYVLDRTPESELVVEVPAPVDEAMTMDVGASLGRAFSARALAFAGSERRANPDGSADVLASDRTIFATFHRALAPRETLQVRGYTAESVRALLGVVVESDDVDVPAARSLLLNKGPLPDGLNLAVLRAAGVEPVVEWRGSRLRNVQRDSSWSFAELFLDREDRKRLVVERAAVRRLEPVEHGERVEGHLTELLLRTRHRIVDRGSDGYRPPRPEELLLFDQDILTPLARMRAPAGNGEELGADGRRELDLIAGAAELLGYRMEWYRHRATKGDFLILAERPDLPSKGRGTIVRRLTGGRPFVVEVPHPGLEVTSFEYGISLFARLQARYLVIAGSSPKANLDGTADVLRPENKASLFNLAHSVILREAGAEPPLVVQSRGFAPAGPSGRALPDVLVATLDGTVRRDALSPLAAELVTSLEVDGLSWRFVDGSAETAGFEAGGTAQAAYMGATAGAQLVVLWVSRVARAQYQQQSANRAQAAQFAALGVSTRELDLGAEVAARAAEGTAPAVPADLRALLEPYLSRKDVVALSALRTRFPAWSIERWVDRDTQQTFLALTSSGRLAAVVNLAPRPGAAGASRRLTNPDPAAVRAFIDQRAGWLELGAP